jgi:hypothetical protein
MHLFTTFACSVSSPPDEPPGVASPAVTPAAAPAPAVPIATPSPRQGPPIETASDLPGVLQSLQARRERLATDITNGDAAAADEEARGIAADVTAATRFSASKPVSARMQAATAGTALRRATLEAVSKLKKGDGAGASAAMREVDKQLAAFQTVLSTP